MASQELRQPLLGQSEERSSLTPTQVIVAFYSILVIITLLIIICDPSCDQLLLLWTKYILGLSIAGMGLEALTRMRNVS